MNDYPDEFDGPCICEVCGKDIGHKDSECRCPECEQCGESGLLECFGTHCESLPDPGHEFECVWHSDHACDSLGIFDSIGEAENAGRDWLIEYHESDGCSFEVIQGKARMNTPEEIALAASGVPAQQHKHFNKGASNAAREYAVRGLRCGGCESGESRSSSRDLCGMWDHSAETAPLVRNHCDPDG